jgi:hypothetical protein
LDLMMFCYGISKYEIGRHASGGASAAKPHRTACADPDRRAVAIWRSPFAMRRGGEQPTTLASKRRENRLLFFTKI